MAFFFFDRFLSTTCWITVVLERKLIQQLTSFFGGCFGFLVVWGFFSYHNVPVSYCSLFCKHWFSHFNVCQGPAAEILSKKKDVSGVLQSPVNMQYSPLLAVLIGY